MPSNKQTVAFLLLPFAAFALLIATSVIDTMGSHFTLPVQGYDPRNLLYGHYLNLRINSSVIDGLKECACIRSDSTIAYMGCEQVKQETCAGVLNSNDIKSLKSLTNPIEVFVDEDQANMLEDVLRSTPARLKVDATMKDGILKVHGLVLDGKPVKMQDFQNPFDDAPKPPLRIEPTQ